MVVMQNLCIAASRTHVASQKRSQCGSTQQIQLKWLDCLMVEFWCQMDDDEEQLASSHYQGDPNKFCCELVGWWASSNQLCIIIWGLAGNAWLQTCMTVWIRQQWDSATRWQSGGSQRSKDLYDPWPAAIADQQLIFCISQQAAIVMSKCLCSLHCYVVNSYSLDRLCLTASPARNHPLTRMRLARGLLHFILFSARKPFPVFTTLFK